MGLFDGISQSLTGTVNSAADSALNKLTGVKSSAWDGLSPHLLATFYPVKAVQSNGKTIYERDVSAGSAVITPILEGAEMEYSFNWQSPFEQMGTEAKAPALSAMLQSGVLAKVYSGYMSRTDGTENKNGESIESSTQQALNNLVGRTGITKLNSTQVFSGMPPIKCSMKLLFRAYTDAKSEVHDPIAQLLKWAVPQELSPDSTLILAEQAFSSGGGVSQYLNALFPSKAPTMIAMQYKNRTYMPLVIEQISDPITSPTTSDGYYASAEVSLTVASLTAWDKSDIQSIYG